MEYFQTWLFQRDLNRHLICFISACDRVYTSTAGQVLSPNYPSVYPNNQQCKYYIIAPPGKKVSIRFETFNLYSNSAVQASEFCYDSSGDNVQVWIVGEPSEFWKRQNDFVSQDICALCLDFFHSELQKLWVHCSHIFRITTSNIMCADAETSLHIFKTIKSTHLRQFI